jgi:signal transduction histidine kinase
MRRSPRNCSPVAPRPRDCDTRDTQDSGGTMRWSTEALRAREQAREEERRRLARELHDDLGQALTGLKMHLSWFDHRLSELPLAGTSEARTKIQTMRELTEQAMQTVRAVITELRPEALDRLGLIAALEWQAETFARRAGLRCRFAAGVDGVDLDMGRATSIFRAFQEMLTNIERHAGASRVDVSVQVKEDRLVLTVRDNGRGFEHANAMKPRAFGILGMKERAVLLGGEFNIESAPRKGTNVTLIVPLANRRTTPRATEGACT